MPSPLASSHISSSNTSNLHQPRAHRKSSAENPGIVPRTSSTSSLHRTVSSKSTSSNTSRGGGGAGVKHHHPHVAHTSASTKHHRATSFGPRVPSYGKGLNKLTALTSVRPDDGPKEHVSVHSMVGSGPTGGTSMQRSLSEGAAIKTLGKKERRPSSGSVHSTKPKVRRSVAHSQPPPVPKIPSTHQQHVKFSTEHSSDDNDGSEDGTLVHRKSTEIVESPPLDDFQEPPVAKVNRTSTAPAGWMPQPPPPLLQKQQIYPYLPQKSALKEGLSSSAPKFLQKSFSSLALAQPTVSHTNAMSKDLGKSATSIEHHVLSGRTPSSEGLVGPSSHPSTSHFVSSTPPSRGLRTPDSEISRGIRRNQSATSLATTAHDHTIPLSTTSQGKLTRTQQKLLLQRASTQPLTLQPTASHASPSIPQVAHMESITAQGGDYFAPMPPTPTPFTPGLQVNVPYDVKVAREFDRISKELVNARRFGDPTAAAICRLRERIGLVPSPPTEIPSGQTLLKKQSTFGLSMAWKRSPDKSGVTSSQPPPGKRSVDRDDVFGIVNRGKVKELARQLWFDEVVLADYMGRLRLDDDEEEVTVRKVSRRRRASARS